MVTQTNSVHEVSSKGTCCVGSVADPDWIRSVVQDPDSESRFRRAKMTHKIEKR
jgi:hypothetical protein